MCYNRHVLVKLRHSVAIPRTYTEKGRKMEDPMLKLEEVVGRLVAALGIERSDYVNCSQLAPEPELDTLTFIESACVGKLIMNGYASQVVAYHGNFLVEFVLAINSWCRDENPNWPWLTPDYPRFDNEGNQTSLILYPTNDEDVSCDELIETSLPIFEQMFKPRLSHIINAFLKNHYYGYGLYAMLFGAEREGFISSDELRELVKIQLDNFLLLYGILPAESKTKIANIKAKNAKEFAGIRKHKKKRRNAKREKLITQIGQLGQLASSTQYLPA